MTKEDRIKLREMLLEIADDPEKVLVHESFFEDQWLQYNPQKECFEYEDHAFIRKDYDNVIYLLLSVLPALVIPSKWHIEQKKNKES